MKELVIATKNPDKRKEIARILKGSEIKVVSLDKYPRCPKVKEGNRSFRENAIRKAMAISKFTKKVALADDSGLETDALKGKPGICSSRFAGVSATYAQNNRKLLKMLKGKKSSSQRGAQFRCIMAVCDYPRLLAVAEGRIRGKIAFAPKGRFGFGYDPIFILPRYKKTFAQLDPKVKNRISHRARALKKIKRLLIKLYPPKA